MAKWPIERVSLNPPPLEELTGLVQEALDQNFQNVSVTVTQCPDLREDPFNLAGSGLCGDPRIADVGGQGNLAPVPQLDKIYSLMDVARAMELKDDQGFMLGAGAGPYRELGTNSELMPNISYKGDNVTNLTHYAKVQPNGQHICTKVDSEDCALMVNLFGSSGHSGPVLKILAANRTGGLNFTNAIAEALKLKYGSRTVSMGGVFVIKRGKANIHVMPDFSAEPLKKREDVERWLKFYDMDSPLVCLTVFHSYDPGLDLRMEHTHCFSHHGDGGHYHFDTTPEDVEYEAYLNVAEFLYRIDRPSTSGVD
jgi:hypothetical protein